MSLPHPDRSQPNPWAAWPVNMPEPVAVRSIEEVGDEVRNVYRATMPNGATAECWTVINSWWGDEEYGSSGDWTPYGLVFDPEEGIVVGPGSWDVFDCLEQWLRQDRGNPCDTCRCSGRVPTTMRRLLDHDPFWFLPVVEPWMTCPTCLGLAWVPHLPEPLADSA